MRQHVLVCIATLMLGFSVAQDGDHVNFTGSCSGVKLSDSSTLAASCCYSPCAAGMSQENKLDLNDCIGVDDAGNLVFEPEGNFADKCEDCSVDEREAILSCQCKTSNGASAVAAALDLNLGIGNNEGTLECNGGRAESERTSFPQNYGGRVYTGND